MSWDQMDLPGTQWRWKPIQHPKIKNKKRLYLKQRSASHEGNSMLTKKWQSTMHKVYILNNHY